MAGKSATTLNMTRVVTKVRVRSDARNSGGGNYRTDDLAEGMIDVFGTQLVDHGDGSHTNCFIVENNIGTLVSRAMDLFKVEEVQE